MCTGLIEKCIRFPQGLSLVLYSYFRTFYFCIVKLRVLVNLKYRKKKKKSPAKRHFKLPSKDLKRAVVLLVSAVK